MYTVQVLLSTYNGETYLKEQLDSILNQKNVAVKLFVRDDGSSDGTEEYVGRYKRSVDIKRQEAEIANIHHLLGKEVEMEEIHDGIEDHGEA